MLLFMGKLSVNLASSYADAIWVCHILFVGGGEECVTSPKTVSAGGCQPIVDVAQEAHANCKGTQIAHAGVTNR